MIPRLIHQTWKSAEIPDRFAPLTAAWRAMHPGWTYRLWTDDDLHDLVRNRFPDLLALHEGYDQPVKRADLGRYLVLATHGGVYADLDTRPLRSLEPLTAAAVPLLPLEPDSHVRTPFVRCRGFERLVANFVMLSPPGAPFWDHLIGEIRLCAAAASPVDATGPMVLTAALDRYSGPDRPIELAAPLFSPADKRQQPATEDGDAEAPYAEHLWAGTWIDLDKSIRSGGRQTRRRKPEPTILRRMGRLAAPLKARFSGMLDARRRARIDAGRLGSGLPAGDTVLIAIPVRDAAGTLDRLFAAIDALDHPKDRLSIAFLEGDSGDDSLARLEAFAATAGKAYRRVRIVKQDSGAPAYAKRWRPEIQRKRRGHIARVRNALLDAALADEAWVLWIDADIVAFPPDTLGRLLAAEGRIVQPDTVRRPGEATMDLNAWVEVLAPTPAVLDSFTIDGLFQPPPGRARLYLSDLRYHDRVRLDSVGGTMLLVDAAIHRAGITFPDRPYRRLIETEAFAALARDFGIEIVGLPRLAVIHDTR